MLQVRPDDDDRMLPGKHPPGALEEESEGAERAAARVTARDVSGKVLASAEDDDVSTQAAMVRKATESRCGPSSQTQSTSSRAARTAGPT